MGQIAKKIGVEHQVILMVDVGDLREGIMIENVLDTVRKVVGMEGIRLVGLGTNMGCFGGVLPEYRNLNVLVKLGKMIETKLGVTMKKFKPSVPIGNIGRDAFGNIPEFADVGIRNKAIVALGKQDAYIEGLIPVDKEVTILGASSDHTILDITDITRKIRVGDELAFHVTYSGLLSVSQSRYVKKVFRKDNVWLN
ncbi:MAG: alanine racemase [Firmicutes bacterium]|nr:alanine racemase [Bacillota bacterium]